MELQDIRDLTGIVIEPGNVLLVVCEQVGTILSKGSGSPLFSRLTMTPNGVSAVEIPQEATHIACRPDHITVAKSHEPCSVWLQGVASVSCFSWAGEKLFELLSKPGERLIHTLKDYQINFCVGPTRNPVKVQCNDGDFEIWGVKFDNCVKYKVKPCSSVVIKSSSDGRVTINGNPSILGIRKFPFETEFRALLDSIDYRCERNRPQRILIHGIRNSGKTSFCHYLLNNIVRSGRRALHVSLSISNSGTVPGRLCVFPCQRGTVPSFPRERKELMFGYETPDENLPLYYLLVEKLGSLLSEWENDDASPAVIDTHSFPTLESLYFMINKLDVTTVILLGMPPGYMSGDATPNTQINPEIEVLEYPNLNAFSIGRIPLVCDLAHKYRGWPYNCFTHHVFVEYENVHIYRVSHNVEDQNNFDPRTISLSDIQIHRVPEENLTEIEDKVCAVSSAQTPDVSAALAEVKYFVLFRGILPMGRHRVFGGKLEFMSPNNLDLRGAILIVGQTIPREPAACRDCPHFACGI